MCGSGVQKIEVFEGDYYMMLCSGYGVLLENEIE